jgi:hypothetical protein
MVKASSIVLIILNFTTALGQELPKREGCIELRKIGHNILTNRKGDLTKRISNRKNRPYAIYSLDSSALVIEKSGYGKHHNTDLRLLDFVEVNTYEQGKLTLTTKYVTDCQRSIRPEYRMKYVYNDRDQLVKWKEFYYETDSLFMEFIFEYDETGNNIKTLLTRDSSNYKQRIFDDQSRLISLQQFYKNQLYWEWSYVYTDTSRIGKFQTFYEDGKDYTKSELRAYKNGRLTEIDERYVSKVGTIEKTIFQYNNLGLVSRVDIYEADSTGSKYHLVHFVIIEVKACKQMTKEIIERVNELILPN